MKFSNDSIKKCHLSNIYHLLNTIYLCLREIVNVKVLLVLIFPISKKKLIAYTLVENKINDFRN